MRCVLFFRASLYLAAYFLKKLVCCIIGVFGCVLLLCVCSVEFVEFDVET